MGMFINEVFASSEIKKFDEEVFLHAAMEELGHQLEREMRKCTGGYYPATMNLREEDWKSLLDSQQIVFNIASSLDINPRHTIRAFLNAYVSAFITVFERAPKDKNDFCFCECGECLHHAWGVMRSTHFD